MAGGPHARGSSSINEKKSFVLLQVISSAVHPSQCLAKWLSNDGETTGRLGLDSIYPQAKRYTDKTVGLPEIQFFAGALDLHKARKEVLSSPPALAAKLGCM